MEKKPQRKILVPLDGSDRSLNTVRYIMKIDPFRKMRIVLFNVFASVPESYWDLEKDPRSTSTVRQVKMWEVEQKKKINQYMRGAKQLLVKSEFPSGNLEVKIQNRKKGVARDIIREAQKGYYAVITRRRGMTGLRGIILGSVATKLVEKLTFLPLILAGREPPGKKILLGFDGSEGSRRAVDFVGRTMGGFDFEVKLIHIIRGKENSHLEIQHLYSPLKYTESIQKKMKVELVSAGKELVALGFKPHQISTELVSGVASRAAAISAESKKQNYGTIVMGRRGHSRVRDFFIGRVTNKVIHLERNRTIWIIR